MTTSTTKPEENRRDPSAWLLLHCFAGPAIGTFVVAMVPLVAAGPITAFGTTAQWHLGDYAMIPAMLLVGLLPGWFLGFIPALLHAVTMLWLRRLIRSRGLWLGLTPVVGWIAVFAPLQVLVDGDTPGNMTDSAIMALVGSAAAVGCMAIAWRRGMYPV